MNQRRNLSKAFTLIELLVVIAIIAILISIMLPALGKARCTGKAMREASVAHNMGIGYASYYTDNKDALLVGGAHWVWNHEAPTTYGIYPADPYSKQILIGSITKVWTLHFVGTNYFPLDGLQIDKPTIREFSTRSTLGNPGSNPAFINYGDTTQAAAYGWHPSYGLNVVYLGGHYQYGAFQGNGAVAGCVAPFANGYGCSIPKGNPTSGGGTFYARRSVDVRRTSHLITFGSSRGGDVSGTAFWGYGATAPDSGTVRPGYFGIFPPRRHPIGMNGGTAVGRGWQVVNGQPNTTWNPRAVPSAFGCLDARACDGKMVVAKFDASVNFQSLEDLNDMTKWCNYAPTADWVHPTNPAQFLWP